MSVSTTSGAVAECLVDLVALISLLAAAAVTAYRGRLRQQGVEALVAGLGLGAGGLIGLLLLPRSHRLVHRFVPARWHSAYERFEHGAVRSLDRLPLLVCYSALGWLIEGATLLVLGAAIGVDLSTTGALVTGLVASLLSVEPFTPGGLGITEPGIVVVLTSLGIATSAASAIALLNRLVNYASLAVAGGVLYLAQRIMQLRAFPASGPRPA